MLLTIQNLSFNVKFEKHEIEKKIPIIFLHGFTGSVNDWESIQSKIHNKFTPIFIDLIGHGSSSSPINEEHYSAGSQIKFLYEIIDFLNIDKLFLVGYSMGGRLALQFSLKFPTKVLGLILESTSFGIENGAERAKRVESDKSLAEKITGEGIEKFIDYWYSLPLFNSLKHLPAERFRELKQVRKKNDLNGLKNTLLRFSTGKMKYLIPESKKIRFKVLLIVGDLDKKFKESSKKVVEQIPNSMLKIVPNTGHNVHFEKPEVFLKLINEFISNTGKFNGI